MSQDEVVKISTITRPSSSLVERLPSQYHKYIRLFESEMSEKLRTKLATFSKQQAAELKRDVIEALRPYSANRGLSFPAEVLIVSGRKAPA